MSRMSLVSTRVRVRSIGECKTRRVRHIGRDENMGVEAKTAEVIFYAVSKVYRFQKSGNSGSSSTCSSSTRMYRQPVRIDFVAVVVAVAVAVAVKADS